ncbi:MAG TPA: 30S ribosome-binding factor RbfA [Nevskia sp.]|nr:30S ribosome-binding factor RbfA [Nevskia sp.]
MPKEFPRTLRLNAQLQRELSSLIREELTDPRVQQVSITDVSISPDMRNARISVSQLGSDAELKAAVKALNGAAVLLRRRLGKVLKLRYMPALSFAADTALREGDRIGVLIREATASDRAAHPENAPETPDEDAEG